MFAENDDNAANREAARRLNRQVSGKMPLNEAPSMRITKRLAAKVRHWNGNRTQRAPKILDPIYPDDVFFVSYPRSGSSWLRRLVGIALHPESADKIRVNVNEVIPDIYAVGERVAQYPRPRMMKSHEPHDPLYPRVVYLYRDARDVALSYYNFYQTIRNYGGTLDDFLGFFLSGAVDFGRWDNHVRSWFSRHASDSFFAVSYEQLTQDTSMTVASVLAFLGRGASQQAVRKAVDECTFERHQLLVKDVSPHYAAGYRGGVSGRPGRGREALSQQQLAMLWDAMGGTLEFLNYRR